MRVKRSFTCLFVGMALSQPLMAIELDLRAGKWGMTTRASMPMAPEPVEQYDEQCIASGYDPIGDLQNQMAQMGTQCEITVTEDTSSAFQADISCPVPGMGTMAGSMSFSVNGDTASGDSIINMSMNGQSMQVTTTTEGAYLGDCN